MRQAEHAADQQEEGDDREHDEEQHGVQALRGTRGISSGTSSATSRMPVRIDPPALVDRIAAEHELAEIGADEGPAGARPAVGWMPPWATVAGGAVGAGPHAR